ncbi:aminoglycoside phosphotransferase family protein [Dactylosporangium sp. NPDC005555]|uniref:phosphotransferase family protein n=1 Tax=Dactylosporangium sp. NPDC005555 TaxID=3154889 RepID=UPI0033AF65C7
MLIESAPGTPRLAYSVDVPNAVSPTQRLYTEQDMAALLHERFGLQTIHCGPLSGGTFATVWRATLGDGRDVAVKVGPPAGVPLLRYERGVIAAEARYYRTVGAATTHVPVPPVLFEDDDVVVVGLLPGRPLTELGDEATGEAVREQLGVALRHLHGITGEHFGYDGDGRPSGPSWPSAFTAMTAGLLADARDWAVHLPLTDEEFLATIDRHADALAEVDRPALVHFDLWDGNVLCDGGRLTGLVDGERYFWGDPLYDFVSTAIGRRMEDLPDHPVLRGYHGGPYTFSDTQRRRLMLYRLQFSTLLLAEMPSRGVVGEEARDRREWVTPQLLADLRDLG